jgi:Domain of unknown function DUF11
VAEPLTENVRKNYVIKVITRTDLQVFIDSADQPKAGGQFDVGVRVANGGLSTAREVTLEITLPTAALARGSVAANGSDCSPTAGGTVFCTIGTLLPGATAMVKLAGTVRSDLADSTEMAVRASAVTSTVDLDADDNVRDSVGTVSGRTVDPTETKALEDFSRIGNSIVLEGEIANPSNQAIKNVFVVQDVPEGQRVIAAAITSGRCDTADRQVLCEIGDIDPRQRVQVRVTSVVDAPSGQMSAFVSDDTVEAFQRSGSGFLRPRVSGQSDLEVSYKPRLVPVSTSANGPLLAAAMLVFVFGLGMVGWVRKGRREDPLALLVNEATDRESLLVGV